MNTYNSYDRDALLELVESLYKKNNSLNDMIYLLRKRLNEKQDKVEENYKLADENESLKDEIEALNQRITALLAPGMRGAWSMEKYGARMIRTILAYEELKMEGYANYNGLVFLSLGYRKTAFSLNEVHKTIAHTSRSWKADFYAYRRAGYFRKTIMINHRALYNITVAGKEMLENLLEYIYSGG